MIVSVVSPVYKARDCLQPLYERLTIVLQTLEGVSDYEILLIEDCGRDGSWELIETLANKDPHLRGVQLSRNFGQHHSITAGLDLCKGDWAIVMDCDLQDAPEDIWDLWKKAQEGYDIVCARRGKRQDPRWRLLSSRVYHLLLENLSGLSYDPEVASFRIISRAVIDVYRTMRESSRSFGAQIHWLGFPTAYIDVRHSARHEGESSYTIRKLIAAAIETVTSYSNKPLRLSVWLGFGVFIAALCVSFVLVVRKIFWSIPIDGWSSLMISLWFLGGLIIANLGVIGLYLGKVYDETRRRPIYVISKKVNIN